jgi:hypothetical protein
MAFIYLNASELFRFSHFLSCHVFAGFLLNENESNEREADQSERILDLATEVCLYVGAYQMLVNGISFSSPLNTIPM